MIGLKKIQPFMKFFNLLPGKNHLFFLEAIILACPNIKLFFVKFLIHFLKEFVMNNY